MKNDFDRVAPIYDLLASLVFGRKLEKAQKTFLNVITPDSKVLVIGGGTGKILEWLPQDLNLEIAYVELSKTMLQKAQKKNCRHRVEFYQNDVLSLEGQYDYVIANFFLDCFDSDSLKKVIAKLKDLMKDDALLFVTDFRKNSDGRDRFFRVIMHSFFRLASNLESSHLGDIHEEILGSNFNELNYQMIDRGQLFSAVYRKS